MLQAYIDDSASEAGDQRLFLAGYVNTVERWEAFSAAWAEALQASPKIAYLRMSEANALGGVFAGWPEGERDRKLKELARVIRHFTPVSMHASVSKVDLMSVDRSPGRQGLPLAHCYCFHAIMVPLATEQGKTSAGQPIEFIFGDQEGPGAEARLFYPYVRDRQSKPVRALLPPAPTLGDDRVVLPLQAADLLAWHVRHNYATGDDAGWFVREQLSVEDGYHYASDLQADQLRSLTAGLGGRAGGLRFANWTAWNAGSGEGPPGVAWTTVLHSLRERLGQFIGR